MDTNVDMVWMDGYKCYGVRMDFEFNTGWIRMSKDGYECWTGWIQMWSWIEEDWFDLIWFDLIWMLKGIDTNVDVSWIKLKDGCECYDGFWYRLDFLVDPMWIQMVSMDTYARGWIKMS